MSNIVETTLKTELACLKRISSSKRKYVWSRSSETFAAEFMSLELAEGSTVLTLTKELEEVKQQLEESRQPQVAEKKMTLKGRIRRLLVS